MAENILEGEKGLGTVRVTLGANASFGSQIQVPVHIDGIQLRPTVLIDGKVLLSQGEVKSD